LLCRIIPEGTIPFEFNRIVSPSDGQQ